MSEVIVIGVDEGRTAKNAAWRANNPASALRANLFGLTTFDLTWLLGGTGEIPLRA